MSLLLSDEDDYYFQIAEELEDERQFVLIIYDITDNKRRVKFAKLLEGYGKRVQKSAFEALIEEAQLRKLEREIPKFINPEEDSVRIYRMTGYGEVKLYGVNTKIEVEDVILL